MNDINYPIKVHELVENCLNIPYLKQVILMKLEQCLNMAMKQSSTAPFKNIIEAIMDTVQSCEKDETSRIIAKTSICSNYAFLLTYTIQHDDAEALYIFTMLKRIIEC
jgi:hypothetical protein